MSKSTACWGDTVSDWEAWWQLQEASKSHCHPPAESREGELDVGEVINS